MSRIFKLFACSLFISTLFFSCSNESSQATTEEPVEKEEVASPALPELLSDALEAHGGLNNWQSMKTMIYTVERNEKPEQHLIDLDSRKVLLTHEDYRIGFDGQEVWVSPNKAAFGNSSARFYHNLRFYFVSMPFIVADPGINYEVLPQKELQGKTYDALRITYDDGIGDAPEDEYILHFDPETKQMEWLLYTVTYYTGEVASKYNALHYSEWQEVNGLMLPQKMVGYRYEDGKIGEKRYERLVSDFQLMTSKKDAAIFEMPEEAEIDSLIVN